MEKEGQCGSNKVSIPISQEESLQDKLIQVYDRFPPGLRKLLFLIVKPAFICLVRIRSIFSGARKPLHLLEGVEKGGSGELKVLIFGGDMAAAYLSSVIFSGDPKSTYLGKSLLWKLRSKVRVITPNPDLIFTETDRFYAALLKRLKFALIPKWILLDLDISKSLPKIMKTIKNRSLDNNLRRMRAQQYTYEITQDQERFDLFYNHMYVPYATKRFGNASWVLGYHNLKRLLRKGQLLLVIQDDIPLTGALLIERENSLFSHSLGVRDGNIVYVEQGAITASYFFTIQWAKKKGYERIDFGYCRPFLRDGVFIYKKRWGMSVRNYKRSMGMGVFGLKINRFSKGVRGFLGENPFIFIDKNKIKGLIVEDQNQPLTAQEVNMLKRIHHINGLDEMIVVAPHGFSEEAREMARTQYPRLLRLVDVDVDVFFEQLSNPKNLELEF